MEQGFGLPGMMIEIGRAVSTDGGVVFVIRHVRGAAWFKRLVPSLRSAIASHDGERFGYVREEKLQRGLLALMAGLAMGYRSVKAIADEGSRLQEPKVTGRTHCVRQAGSRPIRCGGVLWASASRNRIFRG